MELHFLICPECLRYFDQATGETPEHYKHIRAPSNDKDLCKPCRMEFEEKSRWATTTEVKE